MNACVECGLRLSSSSKGRHRSICGTCKKKNRKVYRAKRYVAEHGAPASTRKCRGCATVFELPATASGRSRRFCSKLCRDHYIAGRVSGLRRRRTTVEQPLNGSMNEKGNGKATKREPSTPTSTSTSTPTSAELSAAESAAACDLAAETFDSTDEPRQEACRLYPATATAYGRQVL